MISAKLITVIIIAYLLGNISPATILAKAKGVDIRKEGSGNAGATNTLRVLGLKPAIITLAVDVGKGIAAVLIGSALCGHTGAICCAPAAFLGHVFPMFMKFKGGKGVAVALGVLLALNWKIALILLAIVVVVVAVSRMVSLGSVVAAIVFPVICYFLEPDFLIPGTCMALLVLYKHKDNITRLLASEENKIDLSKFTKKGGKE